MRRRATGGTLAAAAGLMLAAGGGPALAAEGRHKITSLPYTAETGGTHVLVFAPPPGGVATAIVVSADYVTIDLNGFTLDGAGSDVAIHQRSYAKRLTVKNGFLRGWWKNALLLEGVQNIVEDLAVAECSGTAACGDAAAVTRCVFGANSYTNYESIVLQVGTGSVVRDCVFRGNDADDDLVVVEAGDYSSVSRSVFAGNEISGVLHLTRGRAAWSDVVGTGNESQHWLFGLTNGIRADRCVMTDNTAMRLYEGLQNCMHVRDCIQYTNALRAAAGEQIEAVAFGNLVLAEDSVAVRTEGDPYVYPAVGFYVVDTLRGCIAAGNTGFGARNGSGCYNVFNDNLLYGLSSVQKSETRDNLARGNGTRGLWMDGTIMTLQADVIDNHVVSNVSSNDIDTGGLGLLFIGNSVQGYLSLGAARYGQVLEPAPGSAISSENPWANFRW